MSRTIQAVDSLSCNVWYRLGCSERRQRHSRCLPAKAVPQKVEPYPHPWGRQYFMWLSIRIVSWIGLCWVKFLFAIMIAVWSHKTDQQKNPQLQDQNEWQKHTHYVYSSGKPLVLQIIYLVGRLIGDSLLLLNIVKNNWGGRAECKSHHGRSLLSNRWFDGFDNQVLEVADFNKQKDVMREHHSQWLEYKQRVIERGGHTICLFRTANHS